MFKFGRAKTSFHNVRIDSGEYLDMEVSGSINLNDDADDIDLLPQAQLQNPRRENSSHSSFSSPYLETTWTSINVLLFLIYMIFITFMPFYWIISHQIFHYPLTSSCIQIINIVIILLIYNYFIFKCCSPKKKQSNKSHSSITATIFGSDRSSWTNLFWSKNNNSTKGINGNKDSNKDSENTDILLINKSDKNKKPETFYKYMFHNFWLKCKYIIYPSFFFSTYIILVNVAISIGGQDIYILLTGTSIIWFIFLSGIITGDYPSYLSVIISIIITIGAICFSWSNISSKDLSFFTIFINLLAAIFEPLQILFLRRTTRILMIEESETRQMDGINVMKLSEMILFYMILSLIIILPFSLIFEGSESWNNLSSHFGLSYNWIIILIGTILLLFYQLNMISLTAHIEPILMGCAQQSKEMWIFIVSTFLGGITLHISNCHENNSKNYSCDDHSKYPDCPCWEKQKDIYVSDYLILHWFGTMLIILGLIIYAYIKARNLHVTNVNIFKIHK